MSVSQRLFPLLSPQFKDSSSCLAFTRHLALLVWMLSPVVSLHPYFFLRALLLLAGDVEANPGPIQGKEMQYQVSIVVWNCMGLILWIMDCYFICSAYFHGCWINYFVSADYNFATMLQFKLPVQCDHI